MSQDLTSKTKEKKAARDAERRQKTKKSKKGPETPTTQNENENELQKDFLPLQGSPPREADSRKKRKRTAEEPSSDKAAAPGAAQQGKQPAAKKQKKAKAQEGGDNAEETATTPANSRFIVFIGNLPYSATDDSIREHFKSLAPFTLRHRTDPKTKKSKGFAFLEFENYDRMKTCLKLFHHSVFEEPEGTQRRKQADQGGRRINVELTAGGGGKNEGRKEKIRAKNQRLEEQRKRRIDQEKKEKARKERKEAQSGNGNKKEHEKEALGDAMPETTGVHPSRMARIQG